MAAIECAGFLFYSNFDSGNLSKVEWVPKNESAVVAVAKNGKEVPEIPDLEFNLWTKPDCVGTEFENGNRTWFHFGIKGYLPQVLVKLNLVDLNRQAKMYNQGMAPVYRMVPGKPGWERIRDKTTYQIEDNIFTLSFKYKTPENCDITTYFAFTYPYSYTELQSTLSSVDSRFISRPSPSSYDDIYYVRECVCRSLENRRVDLITISSYYNITPDRETRLKYLFPDIDVKRPFRFKNKKIIFVSARVHPGETPSSFVFNGLLNLLLNREDPVAITLRRMYVFKMIPFLNPDGVVKGHYRTDTRGVNLNRVYLNPSLRDHPTVYAARALIRYYHFGFEKEDVIDSDTISPDLECKSSGSSMGADNTMTEQVQVLSLEEKQDIMKEEKNLVDSWCTKWQGICMNCAVILTNENSDISCILKHSNEELCNVCANAQKDSGLYMYIDMHGHASKKGIFMYGNHFDDVDRSVQCMLLPKIMSLNNHNFHFTACNFTERNMYLKDRRDGMSREGSGRVAVLKMTGLVQSYTLECNYNTGRIVNVLPSTIREGSNKAVHTLPMPPKYTPAIYEEVGKAIGASILDLTGNNPFTRIPNSEFHSLNGLQEWLRVNVMAEMGMTRPSVRTKANNNNQTKLTRPKSMKSASLKLRPVSKHNSNKRSNTGNARSISVPVERKENIVYAKDTNIPAQGSSSASTAMNRVFSRNSNRPKGLTLRSRIKRDSGQRTKSKPQEGTSNAQRSTGLIHNRLKTDSQPCPKTESPKRLKVSSSYHKPEANSDRFKLKEICFIKQNLSKKVIAKFVNSETDKPEHDDDNDLVVAWDSTCTPRVLSLDRSEGCSKNTCKPEPSTSTKPASRGSIKSSSFISNKVKRPKSSLRRLASASSESTGKVDKMKKRKKLKSKIL